MRRAFAMFAAAVTGVLGIGIYQLPPAPFILSVAPLALVVGWWVSYEEKE